MELLVFGHAGAKVLVFPTRGGRFYEYEQIRMIEKLRDKIDNGYLQIFCVDSVDIESYYCFWAHPSGRVKRHLHYEEYILREVLPFMNNLNQHPCTISHGCSLGAFHAANIVFKHPHLFQKLCAFSGRYDLTMEVECFSNLLDGFYNDDVYFNTPTHYLPHLNCPQKLEQLRNTDIILTIGKEDPFLGNNLHLSQILHEKRISHQLHQWADRAHRGYYWRKMVEIYL